jgi:arylsulfatase A-like enzyme
MALSLLAAALGAAAAEASASPPNVLIVLTDDQGWGDTGYNCGQPVRSARALSAAIRQPRFAQLTAAGAGRRAASPTPSATPPRAHERRTSTRLRRAHTLCCSTVFTRALASAARLGRAC